MDERTKELIAIGASAAVNCHPCLDYHLAECRRIGIEGEEIRAATEVGMAVNRGAAKTRAKVDRPCCCITSAASVTPRSPAS